MSEDIKGLCTYENLGGVQLNGTPCTVNSCEHECHGCSPYVLTQDSVRRPYHIEYKAQDKPQGLGTDYGNEMLLCFSMLSKDSPKFQHTQGFSPWFASDFMSCVYGYSQKSPKSGAFSTLGTALNFISFKQKDDSYQKQEQWYHSAFFKCELFNSGT